MSKTNTSLSTAALAAVQWNEQGLAPAVAQDYATGRIVMLAWMNAESLRCTAAEGVAVYWSRSRKKLWRKGESSGHVQKIREIRLDCDADAIVLVIEQIGGIACHTGRASCFYQVLKDGDWTIGEPVIKDPSEIYS